jgi:hypothetical protein
MRVAENRSKEIVKHYMNSDSELSQLKYELILIRKKNDRLEQREQKILKACHEWSKNKEDHAYLEFYNIICSFFNAPKIAQQKTSEKVGSISCLTLVCII